LEAMQERSVTLLGNTRMLPDPFFVLASQNPIELEGTYPLPEAQLDRFLFKLTVSDVSVDVLDDIISTRRRGEPPATTSPLSVDELSTLFQAMERMYLPRAVSRYISRLVAASHPGNIEATADVTAYVTYGASPRAAIAMAEASRAFALLNGRPSVGFEDVRAVAPAVMNHRIILNYKARFDRVGELGVVQSILDSLDEAELNLPAEVRIEKTGKGQKQ
jgi:MoxR-like ATPase